MTKIVKPQIWLVALLVAVIAAGGWFFHVNQFEGRILRADPELLPMDAALMKFAVPRGESVFAAHCASCHGSAARGDPAQGVPDLTDADWLYGSGQVDEIERVVISGIRSHQPNAWNLAVMPAFGQPVPLPSQPQMLPLRPEEINDVIEFLQIKAGKPGDAEAAKRGAGIYSGKGGCYDCHSADAKGDTAIGAPNLVDAIWLYGDGSRQSVFESITHGRQGVCPGWRQRLSAASIREAALYVYSLSHRRDPS